MGMVIPSIFVNADTFDDERRLTELQRYEKDVGTKFARSDDSLSTLAHEFRHWAIFNAADRVFGKENILELVQLYSEDLMDDLLKEGYNALEILVSMAMIRCCAKNLRSRLLNHLLERF